MVKSIVGCDCKVFTFSPSVSTDFYVPVPQWNNVNGSVSKDITVFNMWEGELETVDRGLNSQPVVLRGVWQTCGEWSYASDGACFPMCFPICFNAGGERGLSVRVQKIWDIMDDGEEITISDLETCINAVYVVKNFSFDTIKGTKKAFAYSFVLEKVRDL